MIEMYEIQDELIDIYCDECDHFDCPTKVSLEPNPQHKPYDEPCGDFRCCIN